MVQDDLREGFAIKGQCNLSIRKEGADPVAERGGEAEEGEDVNQAIDMEVVKEALNVEEEEPRNMSRLNARLDSVCHAQDCVGGRVIVPRPKLPGGEKVKTCHVKEDPLCDDLLKELATALQEGYRLVCLGKAVV